MSSQNRDFLFDFFLYFTGFYVPRLDHYLQIADVQPNKQIFKYLKYRKFFFPANFESSSGKIQQKIGFNHESNGGSQNVEPKKALAEKKTYQQIAVRIWFQKSSTK